MKKSMLKVAKELADDLRECKAISKLRWKKSNHLILMGLLQKDIQKAINIYMMKENIGFNKLTKILGVSTSHMAKIKNCKANLTLSTIAKICTLIKRKPKLIFS